MQDPRATALNQLVVGEPKNSTDVSEALNLLIDDSHGAARAAGWYTDTRTGLPKLLNTGQRLMLIVSELSEGMEGDRKGLADDKLPHRGMLEVELADAVIRIADFAGAEQLDVGPQLATLPVAEPDLNTGAALMDCVVPIAAARSGHMARNLAIGLRRIFDLAHARGLDLGGAYVEKRAYNDNRADHKVEARLQPGGKQY